MSATVKKAKAKKKIRRRRNGIGADLVRAVTELRDALESGAPLNSRFTMHTVEVPDPGQYTPRQIRRVRDQVSASQAVFARMMGVSPQLVEHWEQGLREPQPWARRLLDLASRDRATFMRLVLSRRRVETGSQAKQADQRAGYARP